MRQYSRKIREELNDGFKCLEEISIPKDMKLPILIRQVLMGSATASDILLALLASGVINKAAFDLRHKQYASA